MQVFWRVAAFAGPGGQAAHGLAHSLLCGRKLSEKNLPPPPLFSLNCNKLLHMRKHWLPLAGIFSISIGFTNTAFAQEKPNKPSGAAAGSPSTAVEKSAAKYKTQAIQDLQ